MALNTELYRKEVVRASSDAPVSDVAELMKRKSVGTVVVMTADDRPLGLVTDRDLMTRVVAAGRTPATPVSTVMSKPLVTVDPTAPLSVVLDLMHEREIRRVGVVESGELVGLVSVDDLVLMLGEELHQIGAVTRAELLASQRSERLIALREELNSVFDQAIDRAGTIGEKAAATISKQLDSIRETFRKSFH